MDSIKALLKQIQTFWAGKDKRFKVTVIVSACAVVAAAIVISVLANRVDYAILYSGLDSQDSAAILSALNTQNEPHRVSGSTIEVPAKDADSLRITLSTQITNGFNLDILQQGQGLGMTESDKQVYRRYQIQADLENSLKTQQGIKEARVVLTMPSDSVLAIDTSKQPATAGVILTPQPGYELTGAQAKAIAEFVQKGVPGLTLDNITIMDNNSRILDFSGSDDSAASSDHYALTQSVQSNLRKQVLALLVPIFGSDKVQAEVNVSLDFSDSTTDSVTYAPVVNDKDGVIVSYQKLKEQIVNGGSSSGQAGTGSNTGYTVQPSSTSGTGTVSYPAVSVDNGTYEKNEDTVNYEVNQVNRHLQAEKGAIKTLSVSVVIDNTANNQNFSDNVRSLVKNAVGASLDNISVEYMPMTGTQSLADQMKAQTESQTKDAQGKQILNYLVVGAAALVLVILIGLAFGSRNARRRAEVDQQTAVLTAQAAANEEIEQMEKELEAIKIVKDNGAKDQIGKLIERNPELVANLLRSWLADDQE